MNTFAHSLGLAYVYIGYIYAICQMLLCCLGNFIFRLLIDFLLVFLLFNLSFDSFMQVFKAVWPYPPSLSSLIPSVSIREKYMSFSHDLLSLIRVACVGTSEGSFMGEWATRQGLCHPSKQAPPPAATNDQ